MGYSRRFVGAGLVLAFLSACAAHTSPAEDAVFFVQIEDSALNFQPILGALPANPADFPASFLSKSGRKWCSGTMVGPGVFLTAAHCLSGSGSVILMAGGAKYSGRCEVAPEYLNGDITADWALCDLAEYPSVPFEVVNADPARLAVGVDLMLVGFGCAITGGSKGTLRYGYASIETVPSSTNHHVVTRGDVAVCFGDSGNAAFLPVAGPAVGRRYQVGVNSRGNVYDLSMISSASAGPAVAFMSDWMARHGREICGLSVGAVGCRPL